MRCSEFVIGTLSCRICTTVFMRNISLIILMNIYLLWYLGRRQRSFWSKYPIYFFQMECHLRLRPESNTEILAFFLELRPWILTTSLWVAGIFSTPIYDFQAVLLYQVYSFFLTLNTLSHIFSQWESEGLWVRTGISSSARRSNKRPTLFLLIPTIGEEERHSLGFWISDWISGPKFFLPVSHISDQSDQSYSSHEKYSALVPAYYPRFVQKVTFRLPFLYVFFRLLTNRPIVWKKIKYSSDHIVSLYVEPIQDSLGVPLDGHTMLIIFNGNTYPGNFEALD